ncbi:hypothetical protein KFE25_008637 [Diacronema lutheri]|uniref:WD repeat domain phosphoinositide-interacting protein 3 n=2 Tax=Diacronema lutheri TaxID=2081491 RepID=A0A8J5XJB1_DIALT|nr:hypothetical protein KFE25_008637 [Diacronema lutheri]
MAASTGLLYVGFNQDHGCFACGTDSGFRIYNCDPFKQTFRRDFLNGGIGIVEMLFRCNILALVGGGNNPRYPPNKVMIWDDHQNRCIGELSFRSEVKAVKLRRDRVVVVLEYKVYVYNFADLRMLHHFETISNPKGLCSLSPSSSTCVLACPGLQKGHLRVELFDIRRPTLIAAHESALSCLALNLDGTRLATASERGTLIRVWDSHSGAPLHELRRGAEAAEIQSLAFDFEALWLAVSSDHGTVHVFSLNPSSTVPVITGRSDPASVSKAADSEVAANTKSSLSFLSGVLPQSLMPKYISSQWSVAQFHTPGHPAVHSATRTICAFGSERNTLIVISSDGSFFKCSFDPQRGGECRRESFARYLQADDEERDL